MDLADIKEKILIASNSLAHLLVRIHMDSSTEVKINTFCETGRRHLKDAAFLATNISWLESWNFAHAEMENKPILVELPNFSGVQWLSGPNQKKDTFTLQLEGLLDDIRSLEIPKSDREKCSESKQRPQSSLSSNCSSIEIVFNEDDSNDTVTSENSTCDSRGIFDACFDLEPSWTSTSTNPWADFHSLNEMKGYMDSMNCPDEIEDQNPALDMSSILDTEKSDWLSGTYKESVLHRSFSNSYPNDRMTSSLTASNSSISTVLTSTSLPQTLRRGESIQRIGFETTNYASTRCCGLKRKAHPLHGKLREQYRWLAPPLTKSDLMRNSSFDTRQWLVDYKLLKWKRSMKKQVLKRSNQSKS